jgi:hypothetical protein
MTFPLDPKEVFGNRNPSPEELYAAFVAEIETLAQRDQNFDVAVKRSLIRAAGMAVAKALVFSETASMAMVSKFYRAMPVHAVAAAINLRDVNVIDSHHGDALLCIAIWAYQTLQVTLYN